MQQNIDTIQQIGNLFEIDPQYITKVTGIPILGSKSTVMPFGNQEQPAGGEDAKKSKRFVFGAAKKMAGNPN